jgi:hypothetical protein
VVEGIEKDTEEQYITVTHYPYIEYCRGRSFVFIFHRISTFPPLTVAVLVTVGFSTGVGGGAELDCLVADGPPSFNVATASVTAPAGESAISLMSRLVKESESLDPRD